MEWKTLEVVAGSFSDAARRASELLSSPVGSDEMRVLSESLDDCGQRLFGYDVLPKHDPIADIPVEYFLL